MRNEGGGLGKGRIGGNGEGWVKGGCSKSQIV